MSEATEQEKRLYIETLANNAKEIYGKDILMYAEKDERGNIKVPMVVVGEAEEGEVSEQEINLKIEHLSSKKGRNIPPLLKSPFDFSEEMARGIYQYYLIPRIKYILYLVIEINYQEEMIEKRKKSNTFKGKINMGKTNAEREAEIKELKKFLKYEYSILVS